MFFNTVLIRSKFNDNVVRTDTYGSFVSFAEAKDSLFRLIGNLNDSNYLKEHCQYADGFVSPYYICSINKRKENI
jgi:hypothetical protein